MRKLVIARDDAGQRVDRFLRKVLPGEPLGQIFKALRTGRARVNGKKAKPDQRLAEGDTVELKIAGEAPASEPARPRDDLRRAADRLVVLFQDEDLVAIDKPPFLLVQPGEGGTEPTLDAMAAERFGKGDSLTFRPALAHRLDRGTSGIVLLGLSAEGLRGLTEAFRKRQVVKRYLALVFGNAPEDKFVVDLPLRRDTSDVRGGAKVLVSHAPDAQPARTEFTVIARSPRRDFALIEARPFTGRTHQIRVHLRAMKLPIVGDPAYGDPRRNEAWKERPGIRRQFLHAWRVEMAHPVHPERPLAVESPLPDDLVRTLRWAGMEDPTGSRR